MEWVGIGSLALLLLVLALPYAKKLGRVLVKYVVAFFSLFLLAPFGGLVGVELGINFLNATLLAVLGLPGAGLLLFLNWFVLLPS